MKAHELTIMSAVATEKAELLSGGATQRVEHVMAPAADAWADFVAGLKSANVIEVVAEPVSGPAAEPQKAAALPPIGTDADVSDAISASPPTATDYN